MKRALVLKVFNTLALRGLGSGVAVLLTVVVARYLDTDASAKFLLLFNITTIASVCFRWGMDDVILRRVSAAADVSAAREATARLLRMAHIKVALWALAAGCAAALLAVPAIAGATQGLSWVEFAVAIVVSALIALSASGGRSYQGVGRTNLATVVLNIAIPGATLAVLVVLLFTGREVETLELFGIYGAAALLAYLTVVWFRPIARPDLRPSRQRDARRSDRDDRRAASRLGGVVLSQQVLNWGALIVVPIAYGAATYTSFNVSFKIASLVSLVMLAVNFTFASRIASLFARGEVAALRRLVKVMLLTVLVASGVLGAIVLLLRGPIEDFSRVDTGLGVVLVLLVVGQVFFALSAVYSLVLTMTHQERYLLVAQGTLTILGLTTFLALSFTASIEWASTAFVATYAILLPILARRTSTALRAD